MKDFTIEESWPPIRVIGISPRMNELSLPFLNKLNYPTKLHIEQPSIAAGLLV
jgi:hypothetical protein